MDEREGFTRAIRSWAGQDPDQGCACCGGPFYNRGGDPVCGGCRGDYPFQRDIMRAKLVRLLEARAKACAPARVRPWVVLWSTVMWCCANCGKLVEAERTRPCPYCLRWR